MKKIKFSIHAIKRALQRKLWLYVSKEKFYYDAVYLDNHRARIGDIVYTFVETKEGIKITTIYKMLASN